MRYIKFRAWDEDRNKMIYDFLDEIESVEYVLSTTDENILYCGNHRDNGDWQEPKLMQFTGLKDKNGIDIYEGDILLCKTIMGKIIEAQVIFDIEHCSYTLKTYGDKQLQFPITAFVKEYEVIGNIYENKK
jgi:uncharacterized phage protein (TIGR01671 family)